MSPHSLVTRSRLGRAALLLGAALALAGLAAPSASADVSAPGALYTVSFSGKGSVNVAFDYGSDDRLHARASLAALDAADVVTVNAGLQAQRLLSQTAHIAGLM